jgi:hypothetical protein
MVEYIWKISFVLNGARCEQATRSEEWSIDELEPKNKKKRVRFTRRFRSKEFQDYWDVYDAAKKQVDELVDAMSVSYFCVVNTYFPTVSDFEVVLENIKELIQADQHVPSHGEIKFTYNLLLNNNGFATTLGFISKIACSSNKDIIRHCLHIFRQGLSYEDSFDKFLTIWRAFNALYSHLSTRESEVRKIEEALQHLNQNDKDHLIKTYSNFPPDTELGVILANHKFNLFDYLVDSNLIDDHGNVRSEDLRRALLSGQSEDIIRNAILCLYVVRCKYFHGSASRITKQENLFTVSSAFLSPLLVLLLKKLL